MLVYSFLVAATLVAVSNAHCGDFKIDGSDPSSNSSVFQGLFTYPRPEGDDTGIFDDSDGRMFESDGVWYWDANATTLYQAQDDEGAKIGNTLDIEAVYNTSADTFKELCEEVWACGYVHLRECYCNMDCRLYSDF
jgi:hypothetical protein